MDALCPSSSVESAERAAYAIVTACAAMKEALALSQSHNEFMTVWSLVRASWNQIEGVARYAGGAANERES